MRPELRQIKVIRRQAIAMINNVEPVQRYPEHGKKSAPVDMVQKNGRLCIAPGCHKADDSRKFCAEWAGREEELLQKIQDSRSGPCLTSTHAIAGKRPLRGSLPFFEPCRSAPAWPRPLLHAPPALPGFRGSGECSGTVQDDRLPDQRMAFGHIEAVRAVGRISCCRIVDGARTGVANRRMTHL